MSEIGSLALATNVSFGDTLFGLNIMQHLGKGNVVMSPYSIRTALSMLREGAVGSAAREIEDAGLLVKDDLNRQKGNQILTSILRQTKGMYTLNTANGLWTDTQFSLHKAFRDILTRNYDATAATLDFTHFPGTSRQLINGWVAETTQNKIPELFPEGSIDGSTIVAFAQALYLKADWKKKFNVEDTGKVNFTTDDNSIVPVDMMRMVSTSRSGIPKFLYAEFDGAQVVSMPYQGNAVSNIFILPPKGQTVLELESHLRDNYADIMQRLDLRERSFSMLAIPKQKSRGEYSLVAPLKKLGVDKIFSPSEVHLSGIGTGQIYISSGYHQACFETNEEGSEGAAATGFSASRSFPPERPIEFIVDRSYLQIIQHDKTGTGLFMNRIIDPTK